MSMPFPNYYWCFSKGLSSQFCDDVVELGKGRPEVRAFTGTEGKTRDTKNKPREEKKESGSVERRGKIRAKKEKGRKGNQYNGRDR